MSFWRHFKNGIFMGRRIGRERAYGGVPLSRSACKVTRRMQIAEMHEGPMSRGMTWGLRLGENLGLTVFSIVGIAIFIWLFL